MDGVAGSPEPTQSGAMRRVHNRFVLRIIKGEGAQMGAEKLFTLKADRFIDIWLMHIAYFTITVSWFLFDGCAEAGEGQGLYFSRMKSYFGTKYRHRSLAKLHA